MLKLNETRSEIHVEIHNELKSYDYYLDFKDYIYNNDTKTFTFISKKDMDINETMELFACIYKKMKSIKIKEFSIDISNFNSSDLYSIVNGLVLTSYDYKCKDIINVSLIGVKDTNNFNEYIKLSNNINIAKELSNSPSNIIYPDSFCNKAKELFKDLNVDIEIFDENKIYDLKMGGLHNVGKASGNKSRFLIMKHITNNTTNPIVLVGKGVTFDTGGYSIKSGAGMMTMKCDMGGAASVLAIFKTLVENNYNNNLICVTPLCENKVDNNAMVPGDVITMYDNTTVEVLNTDAEGRLILADAIAYAKKDLNAKYIIDMATLTGAAANAFGKTITPFVTSSDTLENAILKAKDITGEKFISIKFYKEHIKMLESNVADIKNIGGPSCGVHTSSAFLKHFAPNTEWMHLDIAGTHYTDTPLYAYQQKGAICGAIASVYFMIKSL